MKKSSIIASVLVLLVASASAHAVAIKEIAPAHKKPVVVVKPAPVVKPVVVVKPKPVVKPIVVVKPKPVVVVKPKPKPIVVVKKPVAPKKDIKR